MKSFRFTFHVFIEELQGVHVAHCMEMGLVATHDDPSELSAIMNKLISRQLEFALTNDNQADIYHPAPPEVWDRFRSHVLAHKTELEQKTERHVRFGNWPIIFDQVAYAAVC